jgi:hypothetical protein
MWLRTDGHVFDSTYVPCTNTWLQKHRFSLMADDATLLYSNIVYLIIQLSSCICTVAYILSFFNNHNNNNEEDELLFSIVFENSHIGRTANSKS